VRDEIRCQHFSNEHRGHRPREQPGNQKQSTRDFEHPGNAQLRYQRNRSALNAAEEAEQLLQAVLQE
jgi:hypothetical protein